MEFQGESRVDLKTKMCSGKTHNHLLNKCRDMEDQQQPIVLNVKLDICCFFSEGKIHPLTNDGDYATGHQITINIGRKIYSSCKVRATSHSDEGRNLLH